MVSTKNIISTTSRLTVIFILIIAVTVKFADTYNDMLFIGLLTMLAFLALAIYFFRRKKKVTLRNYNLFNREGQSVVSQIKGVSHVINPVGIRHDALEVLVGNSSCSKPYLAGILNTTTINSNGSNKFFIPPEPVSLDKHIIEDEISTYCLNAKDLVWQIGPAYMGCKNESGNFNAVQFKKNAIRPSVKMIELKLSPVSNSGYCSVLPGYFTDNKNGLPTKQGESPSGYSTFRCAEGMVLFVGRLQELSGGKPVGFRLFIGDKKEFYEICYAIRKTLIIPDFIVIEGSDELIGTTATYIGSACGMPLYEALLFVSRTLQHYGLGNEIKIIANGKIDSGFDMLKMIASGADVVYTHVPAYIMNTYQNNYVEKFRNETIKAMVDIMETCGFKSRRDITIAKLFRRLDIQPLKTTERSHNHKDNMGSVKIMRHSYGKFKGDADKIHAAVQ